MADLEKISLAQLNSALTTTGELSRRRLPDEELAQLAVLVDQMQTRYPSQDMEQSIEGYLADFEQLALKYSLRKVQTALAALRIKPGQAFFPRPDEVASEIEDQRERNLQAAQMNDGNKWLEQRSQYRRSLMEPDQVAWRREKFGYDPYAEEPPNADKA